MTRGWGAFFVALVTGCGAGATEIPLWERPGLYGAERPEMGRPQPGDLAPSLDLPIEGGGEGGGTFRGSSLRGGWVLLHFTASWCPYCDAEVEHLGSLAAEYGPRGVKVVLIDIEEDSARWASYAKEHVSPSVIALRDGTGELARRFAPPHAQPSFTDRAQVMLDSTLILDPEGKIRLFLFPDSKHFDPTFASVRAELERLVGDVRTLPPERVVAIDARSEGATAATAGSGEVVVLLQIAPGYHIMSNHPSAREYIATTLTFDASPGTNVTWGEPRYPSPVPFRVADRSIDTFQGTTEVRIPFEVASAPASGTARRPVRATLRYQACTATACLFPVTRAFEATLP